MPAGKWNLRVSLYVLNIVSFSLLEFINKYDGYIGAAYSYFKGYVDWRDKNGFYSVKRALEFFSTSSPFFWISLSITEYLENFYNYCNTSSKRSDSGQYLVKFRNSYQASIILILLIPTIFWSIHLATVFKVANAGGRRFNQYRNYDQEEAENFESKKTYAELWINYATALSSMVFTYIYWMKDSVGIKLQPIDSGEHHRIPVSDIK